MLQYISGKHNVSKSEMRRSIKMLCFKLSILSMTQYKKTLIHQNQKNPHFLLHFSVTKTFSCCKIKMNSKVK